MRLKELRNQRKLKQIEIAEILSCSQGVYSRYENNERVPPFDIIEKLADYYGVTIDYLLGRDEPPAPLTHDLGHGETKTAPADKRAEAKQLLEGLNDEQYQAALTYIKFLQSQK